ncbi:MAG: hypothetical protein OXF82_09130 [Gammaproteobacteria bacterium]|nr:hypothetical protein [Gammaproteobacteria bacterium]
MQAAPPTLFSALEQGNLSFAHGLSPWLFGLLALLIVAAVWAGYRRTTRPLSPPWKAWFIGLRSAVLILILFCLLRPVVNTRQVSPQDTYLAILLDHSQSMEIADVDGRSRGEAAARAFLAGPVMEELAETFQLRTFAFDQNTRRVGGDGALGEPGTGSAIGQALEAVAGQLDGLPLGGVVLVSDGADNSNADPLASARRLGDRQIPVFTVGVGREEIPLDIGIVDVSAARTVLEGSVFTVTAALRHQGFAGQEVELSVRDGGDTVASEVVTLGNPGVSQRFSLEVTPERAERIVYELRAEVQPGEIIARNNSYRFLVDNTDKPPLDILYIEGHPRNEYKFIRRALADDDSLRLATYLQTGPGKFYRQGIESPTELAEGFPRSKNTLYEYEAIILGDIEKAFFNDDQLRMIEGFVAERGGGLLTSGMVDGEFIGTPLVDILPLTLVEENFLPAPLRGGIRRGEHPTGRLFTPRLTRDGEFSPLLRLAGEDADNLFAWSLLPQLQGVYASGRIKPGAEVLLEHPSLQFQGQALPVLAIQRYGGGRVMSLTTASTWRWQMMMDSADQSHETLWRQMLRWLAVSAPERVTLEFDREFYNIGDEVRVTARVLDEQYAPDNDATLWIQTTNPLEEVTDSPMEWNIEEDGVYRATFPAGHEGVFNLLVDVTSAAGEEGAEKRAAIVVTPSLREFNNAGMDRGLLGRLAGAGGGGYFDLDEVGDLPESIEFTPNAYSREVQIDLWDKPWLLGLLIALLCLDWMTRRLRGLS